MKNKDDRVALQAIEFWSTVCDEEMDLKEEFLEVKKNRNAVKVSPELVLKKCRRINSVRSLSVKVFIFLNWL